MDNPPTDTRAYFRGECLRRFGADIAAASWDSVIFDLGGDSLVRIPTLEPLRGSKAHVGALLDSVDSAANSSNSSPTEAIAVSQAIRPSTGSVK